MNPEASAEWIGVFPIISCTVHAAAGHVGERRFARDHLDEAVLRGVVEVVKPDHALGVRHALREIGDEERRRVGRQDRVRAADRFEPREDLLLDVEVLEDGFDDEVRGCELRPVGGAGDPLADRLRVVGRKIFRSTPSASVFSMMARPRATLSSSTSTRMTGKPSVAAFCAMPLPMLPAPMTANVRTGRGDDIAFLLLGKKSV